jgi:hypothetical protein
VLPGRLPRGLLRHGLAVAVPVLVHHAIEASAQVMIRCGYIFVFPFENGVR